MTRKVIITVSPSSSLQGKDANPNLPEQPQEIADEVYRCYNEGASLVHLHVRDPQNVPSNSADIFRQVNGLVRSTCDIIIQNSIAPAVSAGKTAEDGLEVLDALPEMASLDMGLSAVTIGGVDHPILWTRTFLRNAAKMMLDRGIKPELEIYHDGMFTEAHMLIEEGLLTKPYFFSFVMGMTRG
ncbi:MAG: 3-keto-5-aminohexanoate cleavage protein, partial [Actinobacteria bacterium]|nr:3-keto-5-aminohexanoate cleavage protein [Actinomycetota bacterium]